MKKSVLIFGDNSSYLQGFKKTLLDKFVLLPHDTIADSEELIKNNKVDLVLYAPNETVTNESECLEILNRFPELPSIYILTNDHHAQKVFPVNAIRKVIKPLTRIQDFVDKLWGVLEVGNMITQKKTLISKGFIESISSIELHELIPKSIKFLSEQFLCENIHWVRIEELERIISDNTLYRISDTFQKIEIETLQKSLIETKEPKLKSLVDNFTDLNLTSDEVQCMQTPNGRWNVICPVVNINQTKTAGYFVFEGFKGEKAEVTSFLAEQIGAINLIFTASLEHNRALSKTYIDDLTDLYNQRYMRLVINDEIEKAQRNNEKFSLLFIDIDYFKTVNDSRGHLVGSKLLIEVGNIIKKCIRGTDFAFRYGGDEFVVLLGGADEDHGKLLAERIRGKIEESVFEVHESQLKLTASIGLATYPIHAQSCEDIIKIADEAMYSGKHKSRNIVYIAS